MASASSLKSLVPPPLRNWARNQYYRTRRHGLLRAGLRSVVAGPTTGRLAAVTFDDGPDPDATPRVLEVLARHDARATFFVLGSNVAAHPALTRHIVETGHALGNHTFDHPHLPSCTVAQVVREVRRCQRAIREATGQSPPLMRPPFGAQDSRVHLTLRLLGYQIIHWSASGQDWLGEPADTITNHVMQAMAPGGIILLHDHLRPLPGQPEWRPEQGAIRDRTPTIDALDRILTTLGAEGYRFVTIPQLLAAGPPVRRSWFY